MSKQNPTKPGVKPKKHSTKFRPQVHTKTPSLKPPNFEPGFEFCRAQRVRFISRLVGDEIYKDPQVFTTRALAEPNLQNLGRKFEFRQRARARWRNNAAPRLGAAGELEVSTGNHNGATDWEMRNATFMNFKPKRGNKKEPQRGEKNINMISIHTFSPQSL